MRRALGATTIVTVGLLTLGASGTGAIDHADGRSDPSDPGISAVVISDGSGGGGGGGGSGSGCTYKIPAGTPDELYRTVDGVQYTLYFRLCGDSAPDPMWVPNLSSAQLATVARDEVERLLPRPRLESAPAADRGVVHVGTWLWADPAVWQPISITASVPELSATVTATPIRLSFDPGDGALGSGPVSCDGPGQPWRPDQGDDATSGCMYTYHHSSSMSPSGAWLAVVSFDWHVSFRGSDGTTGDLGRLTTRADVPMRVGELEAVLVRPGQ